MSVKQAVFRKKTGITKQNNLR